MRIDIKPTIGTKDVCFGMDRETVRSLWGEATEFYKFSDDKVPTDDFGYCHVFYDDNNKCEAIEFFYDVEVYLNGKLIFPTVLENAKQAIEGAEYDDDGLISYIAQIGIYAPDEEMETILVGKSGYYN